jgi:hypothetical protein
MRMFSTSLRKSSGLAAALYLTLCLSRLLPAQDGSVETFLRSARSAHQLKTSIAYDYEAHAVAKSNDREKFTGRLTEWKITDSGHTWADGSRLDYLNDRIVYSPAGEIVDRTENRNIRKDGRAYLRQSNPHEVTYGLVADGEDVSRDLDLQVANGTPFDGYVLHDQEGRHWSELLQRLGGSRLSGEEVIDQSRCKIVEADTPQGTFKLWIDPERAYAIRRGEITIGPEDIAWGEELGSRPASQRDAISYLEVKVVIRNITIEEIDGKFIATGGTHSERYRYSDGTFYETTTTVKRSNIRFDPNFTALGAFEPDFPEDTIITHKETGILYRWKNGGLEPMTASAIDRSVDDAVAQITQEMTAGAPPLVKELAKPNKADSGGISEPAAIPSAALYVAFCAGLGLAAAGLAGWWLTRFRNKAQGATRV